MTEPDPTASTAVPPEIAQRIVAWHNRHPLARRISAAQVHKVGLVVLPFASHAAPALPAVSPANSPTLEADSAALDVTAAPDDLAQDAPTASKDAAAVAAETEPAQEPQPPHDLAAPPRAPWWRRLLARHPTHAAATAPALFTEVLIGDISAPAMARLAQAHGLSERPAGDGWPERVALLDAERVAEAANSGLHGRVDRVLFTATLDDGTRRLRLLVGKGPTPHIKGPRLWDRQRISAASASALVTVAALAWTLGHNTRPQADSARSAVAPAASASSAVPAKVVAAAEVVATATRAASAPIKVQALQDAAAQPSIAPSLRPQLAAAARSQAPAPSSQRFALVSAPLRSAAEAQAWLKRMRAEVSRVHHPVALETSAHQSAEGWRVSWWPFDSRSQADHAQAAMAERKLSLELVEF